MKKPSKKIVAKSDLADIKSRMSDTALMEKYKLSAVGLEDLLKKLDELGIIPYVRAMDVVRYLEAGMLNSQLMEKYKCSEEALK